MKEKLWSDPKLFSFYDYHSLALAVDFREMSLVGIIICLLCPIFSCSWFMSISLANQLML
jgi:hypothetical protein